MNALSISKNSWRWNTITKSFEEVIPLQNNYVDIDRVKKILGAFFLKEDTLLAADLLKLFLNNDSFDPTVSFAIMLYLESNAEKRYSITKIIGTANNQNCIDTAKYCLTIREIFREKWPDISKKMDSLIKPNIYRFTTNLLSYEPDKYENGYPLWIKKLSGKIYI